MLTAAHYERLSPLARRIVDIDRAIRAARGEAPATLSFYRELVGRRDELGHKARALWGKGCPAHCDRWRP